MPRITPSIDEEQLSTGLCGAAAARAFPRRLHGGRQAIQLICDPDSAVFGAKDYQQLAMIRRHGAGSSARRSR
jgi:pantothenate synthetase